GQSQPRDAAETVALAQLCQIYKRCHAAATRFYRDALSAQPALSAEQAAGCRYQGACSAAQAGTGLGRDASSLDEKDRTRLRSQALKWLQENLAAKSATQTPQEPHRDLKRWLADPDLAGLRDPEALAKLPEAERQQWQKLWAEVARRLEQTRGG